MACEQKRSKCGSETCYLLREQNLGRVNRNCKGSVAEADLVHSRKSKDKCVWRVRECASDHKGRRGELRLDGAEGWVTQFANHVRNRIPGATINDTGTSGKLWVVKSAYVSNAALWTLHGKCTRGSAKRVEQRPVTRLLQSGRWGLLGRGTAAGKAVQCGQIHSNTLKGRKTECTDECGLIGGEKWIQEWLQGFGLEQQVEKIHHLTR